jgi:para-aminobenzoate synthetase component 1
VKRPQENDKFEGVVGTSLAPVVRELIPAPDPWDVARHLAHLPHLIFFDSSDQKSPFAQYSYVAAAPRSFTIGRVANNPLVELARLIESRGARVPDLPPFQGGVAGLFGYGLGRAIEQVPQAEFDEFGVPDLAFGVYDWVVSFDHARNRAWIVAHGEAAEHSVQLLSDALRQPALPLAPAKDQPVAIRSRGRPVENREQVASNFTRSEYESAVARVIEYIRAGDVFQVNLSQRLLTRLAEHPLDLYGRLRTRNPAPFGGYFDLGDFAIASASPERFLALSADGGISTRPIKGTRRRGFNPAEDFALRDDLQASEKDQAENLMIVDLLRNDLGRVCEYGSVRVERLFEAESYATVHHLVSEVRGQLRPGLGPIDLVRATFPGGSVTGAPKIRATEIIAELERVARGPYCGSLGWIGFDGTMDASILIRTMTCGRGWVQFPVGGGIVADSDPAREYEETLHKAEGMLRALKKVSTE